MDIEKLKAQAAKKIKQLQSTAENLNLQVHLGATELKDNFEKQKKDLGEWAVTAQKKMEEIKGLSAEKATELRKDFEELRVQAALGKADTEEAMKDQQKKIAESLHHLKYRMKELDKNTELKIQEFREEFDDEINSFQMHFDLYKLQLHLGKEEAIEKWEQTKKELTVKLNALNSKLENDKERVSENLDQAKETIANTWSQIKKSFE